MERISDKVHEQILPILSFDRRRAAWNTDSAHPCGGEDLDFKYCLQTKEQIESMGWRCLRKVSAFEVKGCAYHYKNRKLEFTLIGIAHRLRPHDPQEIYLWNEVFNHICWMSGRTPITEIPEPSIGLQSFTKDAPKNWRLIKAQSEWDNKTVEIDLPDASEPDSFEQDLINW